MVWATVETDTAPERLNHVARCLVRATRCLGVGLYHAYTLWSKNEPFYFLNKSVKNETILSRDAMLARYMLSAYVRPSV